MKPLLISCLLVCGACARVDLVKVPEPFSPLPAGSSVEERQAYFEKQKVHVLGSNHIQINGVDYNAKEALRYYDDGRNADSSELAKQAQEKVLRSDDWVVFGTAYGAIAGSVAGALMFFLGTANYDFRGFDAAGRGALYGVAWGTATGLLVGWTGFGVERGMAYEQQKQAAGEFNRMARSLLKIRVAPTEGGMKGGVEMEY